MTSPLRRKRQITRQKPRTRIFDIFGGALAAAGLALAVAQPGVASEPAGKPKLHWKPPRVAKTATEANAESPAPVKREQWTAFSAEPRRFNAEGAKPLASVAEERPAPAAVKRASAIQAFNPFSDRLAETGEIIQTSANEPVIDPFTDPFEDVKDNVFTRKVSTRQPAEPIESDIPAEEIPFDPLMTDDAVDALERELARGPQVGADDCPSPDDLRRIDEISIDIAPPPPPEPQGIDVPADCPLNAGPFTPRAWANTTYTWKASGLCHKPLYFEDVALERYGHSWGPILQPAVSGAHFFVSVPLLPYKMGMNPPWECQYVLGYYRPGSCAPYMIDPIPFSVRGAAAQAAVTTGVIYAFP